MYRLGRIGALVACIMHAIVLPVLSASMTASKLASAELAKASAVICHILAVSDAPAMIAGTAKGVATAAAAPPDETSPASPDKGTSDDCPICKGLAAVQLAVLVSVVLDLAGAPLPGVFSRPDAVDASSLTLATPRNRGPPSYA